MGDQSHFLVSNVYAELQRPRLLLLIFDDECTCFSSDAVLVLESSRSTGNFDTPLDSLVLAMLNSGA